MSLLGLLMAFWIVATVATDLVERLRPAGGLQTSLAHRVRQLSRAYVGMTLAHLGVAVFIIGVTMVRTHEIERDVKMLPGDSTTVAGYTFTLERLETVRGPNYSGTRGIVQVTEDGERIATLRPEKRIYNVQRMPMTEAGIDPGFGRDLYVSLGEPVDGGAWIVRVYVKPFVDWIWAGCVFMALGGLLAISDRRYRARVPRREPAPAALDQGAAVAR
jgi:cytochrome c-type biogenesis protein CcmF